LHHQLSIAGLSIWRGWTVEVVRTYQVGLRDITLPILFVSFFSPSPSSSFTATQVFSFFYLLCTFAACCVLPSFGFLVALFNGFVGTVSTLTIHINQ
jgi:hypothetical protein